MPISSLQNADQAGADHDAEDACIKRKLQQNIADIRRCTFDQLEQFKRISHQQKYQSQKRPIDNIQCERTTIREVDEQINQQSQANQAGQ